MIARTILSTVPSTYSATYICVPTPRTGGLPSHIRNGGTTYVHRSDVVIEIQVPVKNHLVSLVPLSPTLLALTAAASRLREIMVR